MHSARDLLFFLWGYLSIAVVRAADNTAGTSPTTTTIPTFTYRDLSSRRRREQLRSIITTTGIFSITPDNNSDYSQHGNIQKSDKNRKDDPRVIALDGLCQCRNNFASSSKANDENSNSIVVQKTIDHDVLRTTIGSATIGMASPMALDPIVEDICGSEVVTAMEDLRDTVAKASYAAMDALDDIIVLEKNKRRAHVSSAKKKKKNWWSSSNIDEKNKNKNKKKQLPLLRDVYGKEYPTLLSIAESSNHLEHFHIYEKQNKTSIELEDAMISALDWHTDAGLFLAFVPAYDCASTADKTDSSFWIHNTTSGEHQRVEFDTNSIVIMTGIGMQHWLSTSIPIRATRHAVQMQPGQTRAWYGMMHLVPEKSIIQTYPKVQTFGDMKQNMVLSSRRNMHHHDDTSISIGCGIQEDETTASVSRTRRTRVLQHAVDPPSCNNSTNFLCWMQCMEIPNAGQLEQYVQEDFSLYCLDPAILASSGNSVTKATEPCRNGLSHNSNCQGSWQRTAPGVPKAIDFEVDDDDDDGPMKYCYGGTSMYMDGFHWVHDTTCIIYLFPDWVLSSRAKLVGAAFGTILAAMSLELIIFQRRVAHSSMSTGRSRLLTTTILYGLQLTMGYLLMLVIMTYSGVLFLCTILGLMLGHAIWNAKDALYRSSSDSRNKPADHSRNNDGDVLLTTRTVGMESSVRVGGENSPLSLSNSTNSTNYTNGVIVENDENDENDAGKIKVPEGATPCCMNAL